MASTGPARAAGTRLSRLGVRMLLVTGFAAIGWLVATGSASADIKLPGTDVPGVGNLLSANESSSKTDGLGNLVGGLLGGVTNTVGTVTGTVTDTVTHVTANVTNTVNTVTNTVNTVSNTVNGVLDTVGELPRLLPPTGTKPTRPALDPIDDLLAPPSQTGSTPSGETANAGATPSAGTATDAMASATAATATQAAPVTEHPRLRNESRPTEQDTQPAGPVRGSQHKAAPADPRPRPLPVPAAPAAPAAPSSNFSTGGDGGAGARGVLATLAPQASLAPPPMLGRLQRQHPVAERGRTPGLPVTSPD